MKMTEVFNLYILRNKKLIYYLLQSIKDCIPEKYLDKYVIQIDCISKIHWVLDIEVDLYLDKDNYCKEANISDWEEEKKIAEVIVTDGNDKKYRLNFFVVKGHIFSIESNLPFRYLSVDQIKDLQISCNVKENHENASLIKQIDALKKEQ